MKWIGQRLVLLDPLAILAFFNRESVLAPARSDDRYGRLCANKFAGWMGTRFTINRQKWFKLNRQMSKARFWLWVYQGLWFDTRVVFSVCATSEKQWWPWRATELSSYDPRFTRSKSEKFPVDKSWAYLRLMTATHVGWMNAPIYVPVIGVGQFVSSTWWNALSLIACHQKNFLCPDSGVRDPCQSHQSKPASAKNSKCIKQPILSMY